MFNKMVRDGNEITDEVLDEMIESIDELYQIHYPKHSTKKELLHKHLDQLERDYEIMYISEYPIDKVYSIGLKRKRD